MSEDAGKKAQVLLVEDNLSDATLIRAVLEKAGEIRVTLAQDGIRGCQLVENRRWDLIITDFNLPGRDGIEVILASKKNQPETPVISTTGYPGSAHRDGALRGGASEVLSKPIDPDDLVSTARSLLKLTEEYESTSKNVMAIGALPGDVEAGCGGSLIKHVTRGDQVLILVLSVGATGQEAEDRALAARRAGKVLGAEVQLPLHPTEKLLDSDSLLITVRDAIDRWRPRIVLTPSSRDVRESRQLAHWASNVATSDGTSLLCYQAATTTLEFRPSLFEDVSDFLDQKMAALSHYQQQVAGRPHLHPGLARAAARYWGRFLGYGEVEPFEVVRHNL